MAIRVLIADDSELMRRQVRRILESDQQFEICDEAENGVEAVQKARNCRPDLVLMDVVMPEMGGLAAIREIRKTSPAVPILVFTLHDSVDIFAESLMAGADAVLLKARGGVELLPKMRELLRVDV